MANTLEQLKTLTTIVADTGDIEAIKRYQPQDATTNPSLILKAAQIPEYAHLIDNAIAWAKSQSNDINQQIEDAGDKLAVNIGLEILKLYQAASQPKSMHVYRSIKRVQLKKPTS